MAPQGLNVSDVISVSVSLSPQAAVFQNFGSFLIIGSDNIIDTTSRVRKYTSLEAVEADFGATAHEYLAADLYFSQSPQPAVLYIGRWAKNPTKGQLIGGVLAPSQQIIGAFTPVTAGAALVYIDGAPIALTGVSFATALNLNAVANTLQLALAAAAPGTTVVWSPQNAQFTVQSGTSGPISSVSYFQPSAATGFVNFGTTNPVAGTTITLGGTIVTFETAVTNPPAQVLIGATLAATLQNLLVFLNGSTDPAISSCTWSLPNVSNGRIYGVAKIPGTSGNSFTLAASFAAAAQVAAVSGVTMTGGVGLLGNSFTDAAQAAAVSGGTMAGGVATNDLSRLFNFTSTTANAPVTGINPETPLQCIAVLDNVAGGTWYGAKFTSPSISTADHIAVAGYIEGSSNSGRLHTYWITSSDPQIVDPSNNTDVASSLKALGYQRSAVQYSTSSPYAAASLFGRFATVDFNANNSVITGMFKQEPGVAPEYLTETQAAALKAKNCNVYVEYINNTMIVQQGTMANGYFIDEVFGTDWLRNSIQVNCFNELYQSPTKVPQTDAGTHVLVNACNKSLSGAVYNGLVAPGQWNAAGFGSLNQGDMLTAGFYVYAPPEASQAQADRELRESVPIQIAAKLAGAIHSASISILVNR